MEGPGNRESGRECGRVQGSSRKQARFGEAKDVPRSLDPTQQGVDEPLEGFEQGNSTVVFGVWCLESGCLA